MLKPATSSVRDHSHVQYLAQHIPGSCDERAYLWLMKNIKLDHLHRFDLVFKILSVQNHSPILKKNQRI